MYEKNNVFNYAENRHMIKLSEQDMYVLFVTSYLCLWTAIWFYCTNQMLHKHDLVFIIHGNQVGDVLKTY